MTARWEHFPHDADTGVRGFGATKAEAFAQAALAMTAVVVDPAEVEPREEVAIQCEAPDDELLLAEWLNALIFEMSTRKMLFSRFAVRFDGPLLTGQAWGEPVDVARHHPAARLSSDSIAPLLRYVRRTFDGCWFERGTAEGWKKRRRFTRTPPDPPPSPRTAAPGRAARIYTAPTPPRSCPRVAAG